MKKILQCFTLMIGLLSLNNVLAATFTVTRTDGNNYVWWPDNVAGQTGSLLRAITDANAAGSGPHTIKFDPSLAGKTILMNDDTENGKAIITNSNITIDGESLNIKLNRGTVWGPIFEVVGSNNTIKNITLSTEQKDIVLKVTGQSNAFTNCTFNTQATTSTAVEVTGQSNVFTSCTFNTQAKNIGGISLQNNNNTLDKCTFSGSLWIGRVEPAKSVSNITVKDCTIKGSLEIVGDNNNISGCTISEHLVIGNSWLQFRTSPLPLPEIGKADNNIVKNTTVGLTSTSTSRVYITGENNLIDVLTFQGAGIILEGLTNTISNSDIKIVSNPNDESPTLAGITSNAGIQISPKSSGTKILSNQITTTLVTTKTFDVSGIYLSDGCLSNTVDNNNISNFWNNIYGVNSDNNTISNNTMLKSNNMGIYFYNNADNNTISSNIIDNIEVGNGIYIRASKNNIASKNTISNVKSGNGFSIHETTGKNTLTENVVFAIEKSPGILLAKALNTEVSNNIIGKDKNLTGLGNINGISITEGSTGSIIDANTIVGNIGHGIIIDNSSNNTITSNKIGNVDKTNTALENKGRGILVQNGSKNNKIGLAGKGNIIKNKAETFPAIQIDGNTSTGNRILDNILACNAGKGIELSNGGNAEYSSKTNPNWVTINTAEPKPDVISGKFQKISTGNVTIDIYATDTECHTRCSATPNGTITPNALAQGKTWITSIIVLANKGEWSYTLTAADKNAGLTVENAIVTATDGSGNTSEFAVCEFDPPCTKPTSVTLNSNADAVCDGATITLTATANPVNANNTIEWYKDNVLLDNKTASLTISNKSQNGIYKAFIYDTDKTLCGSESATKTLQVNDNPTDPTFTEANKELCSGTLSSTVSVTKVDGMTYQWNTGSNPIIAGGVTNEVTIDFSKAINPTIIKVKAINGVTKCESKEVTLNVTINALPTPIVDGDATPLCNAQGVVYTIKNAAETSKYVWTIPTGATQQNDKSDNNDTLIVNYADKNGNITVTETNAKGCIGKSTDFAIALKSCGLKADFGFDNNGEICIASSLQKNTITFTDKSIGDNITSYVWNFGEGATPSISGDKGPHNVQYATAGTKTVKLTITDNFGTESTATYTVKVNNIPNSNDFLISQQGECQNTPASFELKENNGSGVNLSNYTYDWSSPYNIKNGQKTTKIDVLLGNELSGNVKVKIADKTTTCQTEMTSNVSINVNPTPIIEGDATPLCKSQGIIYTVKNTVATSKYVWTIPTEATQQNDKSGNNDTLIVNYSDKNGNITVTETTEKGCIGKSADFTIALKSCGLKADFEPNNSELCVEASLQKNTVTFTDLSTGDNITSYVWNFGEGATPSISGDKGPHTVQYATAGTKTIQLTITDEFGTESTATHTIKVNDVPSNPVFTDANKELCSGTESSTVSVTKEEGMIYEWNTGSNDIIAGGVTNEVTIDFSKATDPAIVKVKVKNALTECENKGVELNVKINPNPTPIIEGDATPLCKSEGVVYTIKNAVATSNYVWTIPNGATQQNDKSGNNDTLTVNYSDKNGNITVTETNAKGCIGKSADFVIALRSCGLKADFGFDNNGEICIASSLQKNTITFTDKSEGNNIISYVWKFGEGATPSTLGEKGPHTVQYTTTGTKNVELKITDNFGTESTATYTVKVNNIPNTNDFLIDGQGGCQNTTASFELKENNESGVDLTQYNYDWSNTPDAISNGKESTKVDITLGNSTEGTVKVKIADKATTCQIEKSKDYQITEQPNFNFKIAGNFAICDGASQLSKFNNDSTYTYQFMSGLDTISLSDIHPQTDSVFIYWKLVDANGNLTDLTENNQQGFYSADKLAGKNVNITLKPGFLTNDDFKDYKLSAIISKKGACADSTEIPISTDIRILKAHKYEFSIKDLEHRICEKDSANFNAELKIDDVVANSTAHKDSWKYIYKWTPVTSNDWWKYVNNWTYIDANPATIFTVTTTDTIFKVKNKNNSISYVIGQKNVGNDTIKDKLFLYNQTNKVIVDVKDSLILKGDKNNFCYTEKSIFADTLTDFTIRRPQGIIGLGTKNKLPDTTKLVIKDVEAITLKDMNSLNTLDNTKWQWAWKDGKDFINDSIIDPTALSTVHYPRRLPKVIYRLITTNEGCPDTTYATLTNLLLPFVPSTISPNEDGVFDTWQIHNSENYPNMVVKVFNRWGALVYESEKGYPVAWNGTRNNGDPLPTATYFYVIEFNDEVVDNFINNNDPNPYSTARTKEASFKAGSITIMR